MIDHKVQFKIKLTGDNSTEYVPVVASGSPKYTMTVDWGDGSTPSSYTNKGFVTRGCSHAYTGAQGDEFTITLRGSAIPYLAFQSNALCNIAALVAVLDNTLECSTRFADGSSSAGGFYNCSSLAYLSANALQNSTDYNIVFRGTRLSSFEDGFFTNIKNLTVCSNMFNGLSVAFSASHWSEIKTMIKNCKTFYNMFYGFKGDTRIPDDFFSEVVETITSMQQFTHTAKSPFTGDAAALYQSLLSKVSQSCDTTYAFSATSLSNRNQVPSSWGGTGS